MVANNRPDALKGKKVAILVTDGFEQSEMTGPREVLDRAGATTVLIAPKRDRVVGWKDGEWGDRFPVDQPLESVNPDEFDALVLPGGVMSPDKLRMEESAVQLVRRMFDAGKPIGAICHGPWLLVEADVVRGMRVTSYPSVKTDLTNAGASWADEEVVTDSGLVTSRKPDDIPAFSRKLVEEIAEGVHYDRAMRRTKSAIGAAAGTA